MRLYLVRHGKAEEKAGKDDASRALTPEGRRDIAAVAPALGHSLERPLRLISSPYLRAEQTAEALREVLGIDEKLEATDALLPESGWHALRPLLLRYESEGVRTVVAVGHNPSLSLICSAIVGGSEEMRISLSKGAVACLELDAIEAREAGELLFLVTPGTLRDRGRGR